VNRSKLTEEEASNGKQNEFKSYLTNGNANTILFGYPSIAKRPYMGVCANI
jgi:hypothetical protein